MNYRHIYHAGNFADVVKHITLIAILEALSLKETAFCYLDTHAGIGYYDLTSEWANKTKEYTGGIEKIMQQPDPPPLVIRYLNYIKEINQRLHSTTLHYYPGSPLIAHHFSREQDRIVTCELQMQQYQALKATFNGDKKVIVHHMDGFLGLKAFLPPPERRGLVLIDPPYEHPDEFSRITQRLPIALKRWDRGIYTIWYPLKEKTQLNHFHRNLKTKIKQPVLIIELSIHADLPNHLHGSGLAIINPPWRLDELIKELLPWLWKSLTINHQGNYRCFLLNN